MYFYSAKAFEVGATYWCAAANELLGVVPRLETARDFGETPAAVTSTILPGFPFCRIWDFTRTHHNPDTSTIVIVAPNSGSSPELMDNLVREFLAIGNVCLIGPRDPHYFPASEPCGLDASTEALLEVARRHPHAHWVSVSQSGIPTTVATAWMFQNPHLYKARSPASLTVIGSPINTEISPGSINWMAKNTYGDSVCIPVGPLYEGVTRMIFPAEVMKLSFEETPDQSKPGVAAQSMTSVHVNDTLRRVFREHWLSRGNYIFNGRRIDTTQIACPVITVEGRDDRICTRGQTHFLGDAMTPQAPHVRITAPTNHYGLIGSDESKRRIVPAVAEIDAATRAQHAKRSRRAIALVS